LIDDRGAGGDERGITLIPCQSFKNRRPDGNY